MPFHYGLARTVERVLIDLTAIFSIKDFSASKLQGQPGLVQLTNGQPKSSREQQQGKSDINVWGEDDVDSVKVNIAIKKIIILLCSIPVYPPFQSFCLLRTVPTIVIAHTFCASPDT